MSDIVRSIVERERIKDALDDAMLDRMDDKGEEKDTAGIRVAVYGSLREGLHNHGCLSSMEAEKLGDAVLLEGFRMVSLGSFPAVLPAEDALSTPVHIEVYRISDSCLKVLDSMEGHPEWYKREKVVTPWKNAWMYVMPPEQGYEDHNPVDSGDWLDYYIESID